MFPSHHHLHLLTTSSSSKTTSFPPLVPGRWIGFPILLKSSHPNAFLLSSPPSLPTPPTPSLKTPLLQPVRSLKSLPLLLWAPSPVNALPFSVGSLGEFSHRPSSHFLYALSLCFSSLLTWLSRAGTDTGGLVGSRPISGTTRASAKARSAKVDKVRFLSPPTLT